MKHTIAALYMKTTWLCSLGVNSTLGLWSFVCGLLQPYYYM